MTLYYGSSSFARHMGQTVLQGTGAIFGGDADDNIFAWSSIRYAETNAARAPQHPQIPVAIRAALAALGSLAARARVNINIRR